MGNPKSPNFSIGETASDLDLCGIRNAIQEIDGEVAPDLDLRDKLKGGNQIHKIDSARPRAREVLEFIDTDTVGVFDSGMAKKAKATREESQFNSAMATNVTNSGMAKEAKETRQVLEFTDVGGVLSLYKNRMRFEREDFDPKAQYFIRTRKRRQKDYHRIKEMEEHPYNRERVLKYITQVRNSGGFDVDVTIPTWLHAGLYYFIPLRMSYPDRRDFAYKLAKFAIDEINVDLKSKAFELVEVEKAVMTDMCHALAYLTLAVKKEAAATSTITIQAIVFCPGRDLDLPWDLRQWRVKPHAEAQPVELEP